MINADFLDKPLCNFQIFSLNLTYLQPLLYNELVLRSYKQLLHIFINTHCYIIFYYL